MAEGGDKAQDALYEFQELGEKYNMSLMLTNGMALANLHMSRLMRRSGCCGRASAERLDVDTLANMVVCNTRCATSLSCAPSRRPIRGS